jgi:hypothetical protein
MTPYHPPIEQKMKKFYETLSEKDKRGYAGVEAMKFGRGGVGYLTRVLGCSRKTVIKGLKELNDLSQDQPAKKNASGNPAVGASVMRKPIRALTRNFWMS